MTCPQRRRLLRGVLVLLLYLLALPAPAEEWSERQEARVEAAYLINFLRYTEWPPSPAGSDPHAPWVIAVIGPNWVVSVVRSVATSAGLVQGRPVVVRPLRLRPGPLQPLLEQVDDTHLLFVHAAGSPQQRRLLHALRHRPVLTVGAGDSFVAAGGMLSLLRSGEHVVFAANPTAIRDAGLVVSAKVLKLARIDELDPR
jgi:hypothetical protein